MKLASIIPSVSKVNKVKGYPEIRRRNAIREFIPNFEHEEKGKNLDSKM